MDFVSLPDYDCLEQSSLHKTLGLQCNRYLSYIGPTVEMDSLLLSYYDYDSKHTTSFPGVAYIPATANSTGNFDKEVVRTIRRMDLASACATSTVPGESTAFVLLEDHEPNTSQTTLSRETLAEIKELSDLVGSLGPKLMDLFLRNVLPCFPVMHRTTLLDKFHGSPYELAPSVLASIYAFSLSWWAYDKESSSAVPPSQETLKQLSRRFFDREVGCPTLSTIQTGLLIIQYQVFLDDMPNPSWVTLSKIVGMCYELGLHIDPETWDIPHWEKVLRKRIAWAVFIQDKWSALTFGRPSLIQDNNWTIPALVLETDFSDLLSREGIPSLEHVNHHTGILLYIELIKLTKLVSDILNTLFCATRTVERLNEISNEQAIEQNLFQDLDIVKGFRLRLQEWYRQLPSRLSMNSLRKGELSANGNLHIAFCAAEMTLFRPLLKSLACSKLGQFVEVKKHVYKASLNLLTYAVGVVSSLSPQHLQTFWYCFIKQCLALFATFGFLLFVAADDLSLKRECLNKIEEYRWSLAINSNAAPFVKYGISWIDHYHMKMAQEIKNFEEISEKQNNI